MIFLSIGTQVPFDRLVKAVDEIAPSLQTEIVAQVSKTTYKAQYMKTFEFIAPHEFDLYFNKATLIVSHAGMGNIISALEREKPILVLPRLAKYGEHRNDHQMATARVFEKLNYVHVAYDAQELQQKLLSVYSEGLQPLHKIGHTASPELIASIKSFITKK